MPDIDKKTEQVLIERKAKIVANCPHCQGRKCPICSKQFALYLTLARSQVPMKLWDFEVDSIDAVEVRDRIKAYVGNLKEASLKGYGLYLYGSNGVGKSMSAAIILKNAIRMGYEHVRFIHMSEVVTMFFDGMYNKDLRREYEKDILEAEFLVLDEIDKAYKSNNGGFADSSYDLLFRTRANRCRPTIVTANTRKEEFLKNGENLFGKSLLSLFAENMSSVMVFGQDRRMSNPADDWLSAKLG